MDTPGHGHKPLTKAGVQAKTWVHVSAFADKRNEEQGFRNWDPQAAWQPAKPGSCHPTAKTCVPEKHPLEGRL